MTDTLNKQKGKTINNPIVVRDYKADYESSVKLCDALQNEKIELAKQKQMSDERSKALSSEVLSLRTVVVQLCKERYGV